MKKISKFKKHWLALMGGFTVAGAVLGTAIPLATSNHDKTSSNVVNTNSNNASSNSSSDVSSSSSSTDFSVNGPVISTDSLNIVATGFDNSSSTRSTTSTQSLSLASTDSSSASSSVGDSSQIPTTDKNNPGKKTLTTVKGEQKEFLVSTAYQNNRKFMPILAYDESISYYNYQQSRSFEDTVDGNFPGWDKSVKSVEQIKTTDLSKTFVQLVTYKATETLKKAFKDVQSEIKQLYISLDDTLTSNVINELIQLYKPDYVRIENVNNNNIKQIPNMKNDSFIKKLDISGDFSSVKGVVFPNSTEELRIVSENIKSIDPLQLPENAAIITENVYDARFTEIDLSSHTNLSTEDLQKAVNIVYEKRINERAFQGNFAGGYIYSWNLQHTGKTSFNEVKIPELNDGTGRFYIAYVAISSGNSNGTANETITEGNTPSNDSQIGEWWDSNANGWSKVTTVNVTAKDGSALNYDKTVKEIMGFLAKYPSVTAINISSLTFTETSKTLDNLKDELVKEIKAKYGEDSSYANINFITKKDSSESTSKK